jgi:hypothetical protein
MDGDRSHVGFPADQRSRISRQHIHAMEDILSRSGYTDDDECGSIAMWRGQVASAIRGKRGQAFLREMLEALDALPEKRLIANRLVVAPTDTYGPPTRFEYYRGYGEAPECGVCAIGTVGLKRGIDMYRIDPEDYDSVANAFGIAHQLVQEIEYVNDEMWDSNNTAEGRWRRVRAWAVGNIKGVAL